jgi:hypothetical protein
MAMGLPSLQPMGLLPESSLTPLMWDRSVVMMCGTVLMSFGFLGNLYKLKIQCKDIVHTGIFSYTRMPDHESKTDR